MSYLLFLCFISCGGSTDISVEPCFEKQDECPSNEDALPILQEQNPDCLVESADFEGEAQGQCCYNLVISKCGEGSGEAE